MKKNFLLLILLLFISQIFAQEKHILTSDNVDLFVRVKGKGPFCLYLHGGPGAGSFFLEKLVGDYLEQHFQMVYLDQRGCGRSGSPKDNNYSMDRMTKDFEEVRNTLGIDNWVTLGHSFGGILQMGYIQKYPDAINAMIMINCTLNIPESFNESWFPKASEFLNIRDNQFYLDKSISINTRLDSLVSQLIKKDLIWKMSFASKNDNMQMNKIFVNQPRNKNDFFNFAFSEDYLKNYLIETEHVEVPVLFFYGIKDWCVGPKHYKHINFPNMILWKSNVEHMMPFLEGKPELEKAINFFIEKHNIQ